MKGNFFMMLRKNPIFLIMFVFFNTFNIFAQSADVTQGCFPLTVQFTNQAGVAKPFWDFGDGVTSELLNPKNTFTKAGNYTVELRQGSKAGALLGTVKISVYAQPTLGFKGAPLTGCTPLISSFTPTVNKDDAIVINSYKWDFGDGKNSTDAAPKNTYTKGGKFTVALGIKTNFASCDVTAVFKDTVKTSTAPFVVFSTNPAVPTACAAPLNVSFNNASNPKAGINFAWDLGNGTKVNTVDAPSQTYTKNGAYTVSLTGTDAIGCKSTYSVVVSVGKPKANFAFPNDTLCLNAFYSPTNLSAFGSYTWNFGKDALVSDPTTAEPTVQWNSPGLKKVTLNVVESSGACKSDTSMNIFIEDRISPFKSSYTPVCNSPVTVKYQTNRPYAEYSWFFVTNPLSSSTIAMPTVLWKNSDPSGYSRLGQFGGIAKITTVSYAGCKGTYEILDTFGFANARIVPDKWQGCAPLTVAFADSSYSKEKISSYTFLWADGSAPEVFTTKASHDHTFTKAGTYKVRMVLKNEKGCIDTSHVILIKVGDKIKPDFSADKTTVCPGDTVKFKDITNNPKIDTWHFGTDGDRSSHCSDMPSLAWKYTNKVGPQSVTLTVGYNGCFESTTKTNFITVNGPIAKIDYNVPCSPKNRDVVFNSLSEGATDLNWNFGDTTNSTLASLTHNYKKSGDYWVKLTATNSGTGCKPWTDSVKVHVRDLEAKINISKLPFGIPAGFNLCLGQEYSLSSAESIDVHSSCNTGATWYFSDPQERPITTADASVKFTPKTKGDYKIILAVKDINGCVDSLESKHRVFGVYPKVTYTPKEICTPMTVQFNGSGTTSDTTLSEWTWKFGDGKEAKTKNTASYNYTTQPLIPGLFIAKLELMDAAGCSGSWTDTVKVYAPISNIIAKNAICLGDTLDITATDYTEKGNKLSFQWVADGKNYNTQSFKTAFSSEGEKKVTLNYTESNTGCKGTISKNIQVQVKPTVGFEVPKGSLCVPSIIEFKNTTTSKYQLAPYSWDFGNGKTSNEQNGSSVFDKVGTYKITLFAETSAGCRVSKQETITTSEKPKGDFTMSKSVICLGESITFTLKDTAKVSSFQWFYGDGADKIGENPSTHAYTSRNVLSQATTVAKLKLTAIGGGCETTVEKPVTINKVIADFAITKDTICALLPIEFLNKSINATKYTWDFGDGTKSEEGKDVKHIYKKGTSYKVTLSVENSTNGCKDAITKPVTLIDPKADGLPDVPSIFTPDGDNDLNKVFTYVAKTKSSDCATIPEFEKLQIFDRWGRMVHENAVDFKWNGDDNNATGNPCPSDVYLYIFYLKNGEEPLKGNVTLLR